MRYGIAAAAFIMAVLFNAAYSNYWFQFGARAGSESEFNYGAELAIQTVIQQTGMMGSPGFWVGEDLSNGAFLQAGYLIVNQTASYPTQCDQVSLCAGYERINDGQAEWFYEYFPQNYGGSNFLGAIGPAGSAGANGTINTYGFYANGTQWIILFNGAVIGRVNLGAGNSGSHSPVAFGELANTTNNATAISPVLMENFSIYNGASFTPVITAYSYRGYGEGSQQGIQVPYGVQEMGDRVNHFAIGSGLAMPGDGTQLWGAGYSFNIKSEYGNLTNSTTNLAYSRIALNTAKVVYLNNSARAVFAGWKGSGFGSYTGASNSTTIVMESNITETAEWQLQYFVNVSSDYGKTEGTGWYYSNSIVNYGINATTIYHNSSVRDVFEGWSNGSRASEGSGRITSPIKLTAAWQLEYLLNITSQYGNTTKGGWKPANSSIEVSVYPIYKGINGGQRLSFYSWSNGNRNSSFTLEVSRPASVYAEFVKQYLYTIRAEDSYGNGLLATTFFVDGKEVNGTVWLFEGQRYNITRVYYKGLWIQTNTSGIVNSSSAPVISLPVYNVEILTRDIFGAPVNASAFLRFANGTASTFSTGADGSLVIADVPYGSATGTVKYFILSNGVNAKAGSGVISLTYITPLDLLAFIIIIAAAAAIYLYSSRRLHHQARAEG